MIRPAARPRSEGGVVVARRAVRATFLIARVPPDQTMQGYISPHALKKVDAFGTPLP